MSTNETCRAFIRNNARFIAHDCQDIEQLVGSIGENVRRINSQPEFETMAEDALVQAEAALRAALVKIVTARAELADKPPEAPYTDPFCVHLLFDAAE